MEDFSTSNFIRILYVVVIFTVASTMALPKTIFFKKLPESQTCLTPGCIHAASTVLKNLNSSVDPCDDFYRFACEGFVKRMSIPADQSLVTSYSLIRNSVQEKLKTIIEEIPEKNVAKPFLQVKQLYQACLDTTAIEKKGLETLRAILKDLGGWAALMGSDWNEKSFDWRETVYKLRKWGYTTNYLLSVNVVTDPKNSTQRVIIVDQGKLGLNQNYFLKGVDRRVAEAYLNFTIDVAVILGANRTVATKDMQRSLVLEGHLAKSSVTQDIRRNISNLYNPMTIKELQVRYTSVPWQDYISKFLGMQIDEEETIIMMVPSYMNKLDQILKQVPPRILANYLVWRAVQNSIAYLPQKFEKQRLEFNKIFQGTTERKHRSKECVDMVAERMHLAVGALYARQHFSKDAKKKLLEMVSDIQAELVKILQKVDWMDDTTRMSALEKAAHMTSSIAYSDELYDDGKLEEYYSELHLKPDDYLLAFLNVSLFRRSKTVEKLRDPVDKTDWTTRNSPAIVNAYYDFLENSIQFPAAILQGAYFENDRPNYMNYGAIGNVIGHEITHGFDDKGRQYDKNGNLVDWWDKQTSKAFNNRAECIIEQYSNFGVPGIKFKLNGLNTQGENIADNGGIKEAYLAYQEWVRRNGLEPQLPGLDYTPNQMFWISAASPYCSKSRIEYLKLMVLTDPHSPEEFRVNVPFSNTEYFAKDYNCPLGSKMNPVHKCQVW